MHASFQEPEELLAEESFYNWYLKCDEASIAQWDSWIKENPANEALAGQAVAILKALPLRETAVPAAQVEAAYQRLQAASYKLQEDEGGRVVHLRARRWWMAAAAVVILAAAGLGILKYTGFFAPTVETQYGQIKEERLPDGSEVTLNAHSKISYFNEWKDGKDREVWINGEAFFHVKKTPQKSRFIVHTGRFDIIVTGTRFNVINRDGITNVLLQEGSVIVRSKDGREIYMKPGDFVEVNDSFVGKKPADPVTITAWKERKMVFDSTSMTDAARMIETDYGVQVVLADSNTTYKPLTGILPNDNLDVLLTALEATQDFKVERNGNTIVIRNHP